MPMRKVHTFSVPPNMVAPLLALLAIGVAPRSILYGYIVILVIIVGYVIHIPFAVRSRRFLASAPGGVGATSRDSSARRGAAIRRAQPHRRSMARLGLRRPPGPDVAGFDERRAAQSAAAVISP